MSEVLDTVEREVWKLTTAYRLKDEQMAELMARLTLGAFQFRRSPQGVDYWFKVIDEFNRCAKQYDREETHV